MYSFIQYVFPKHLPCGEDTAVKSVSACTEPPGANRPPTAADTRLHPPFQSVTPSVKGRRRHPPWTESSPSRVLPFCSDVAFLPDRQGLHLCWIVSVSTEHRLLGLYRPSYHCCLSPSLFTQTSGRNWPPLLRDLRRIQFRWSPRSPPERLLWSLMVFTLPRDFTFLSFSAAFHRTTASSSRTHLLPWLPQC